MASQHPTLYQPLDPTGGIRVLIVEPGSKDSHICCRLVPENITRYPDYRALSYEWGFAADSKAIKLNGQIVSVRQNLWWALWHLRDIGLAVRLWVDALCINQEDDIERGHQVSMMGSIYKNAEVICWLGNGDQEGKFATVMKYLMSDRLHQLQEVPERQPVLPSSFPRAANSSMAYYKDIHHNPPIDKSISLLYRDVEALCSLSYWRRTWIIQEVVLANRIQIRLGDISIGEIQFTTAVKAILLKGLNEESLLMVDAFRILGLRSRWHKGRDLKLLRLMEFSERSSCQDLRDKVYAMIGLASDCQDKQLVPNYTKSLWEVYSDVILHHFYHSDCEEDGSSWLLVQSSQLVQRAFWRISESLCDYEHIFLKPRSSSNVSEEQMIKISGIHCGTVVGISDPEPGGIWWAYPGLVKSFAPERSQNHTWAPSLFTFLKSVWSPVPDL
jgi:Heterokaryon incompatibility protein (HET)